MPDYLAVSAPRISRRLFRQALDHRRSPATGLGDELYKVCLGWSVDPAVALAMFTHESQCGTQGVAVRSLNFGNLRRGPGALKTVEGFAQYASWVVSCNDYCRLIAGPLYYGSGLRKVSEIIRRYAPSGDRNNPAQYAAAVNHMVEVWERLSRKAGEVT